MLTKAIIITMLTIQMTRSDDKVCNNDSDNDSNHHDEVNTDNDKDTDDNNDIVLTLGLCMYCSIIDNGINDDNTFNGGDNNDELWFGPLCQKASNLADSDADDGKADDTINTGTTNNNLQMFGPSCTAIDKSTGGSNDNNDVLQFDLLWHMADQHNVGHVDDNNNDVRMKMKMYNPFAPHWYHSSHCLVMMTCYKQWLQ